MILGKTGDFYWWCKHIQRFMLFKIVNKQRKSDQKLGKQSGVKRDCCCDLFYFHTKTNAKNLDFGKSVGWSVALKK